MGLLNKIWSGADFWDKKENKQQRDQFAQQDEERKKREAEARAQKQAQQQAKPATVVTPTVSPIDLPRKPMEFGPQVPQPEIIKQLYKPIQQPSALDASAPAPKVNKFGNPEPVRGREKGQDGTYYTGKVSGKRTFVPDPIKEDNSTWGKIKRGLGIAQDTAQGTVGAAPQVVLAGGRTATGLIQGAGQLPHMASATIATGTDKLEDAWSNPVTRGLDKGAQGLNTGVKTATHYAIDNVFDPINRNLDEASRMYGRTVQDSEEMGTKNYEQTQIGLNVLAALLTMGGSAGAGNAGRAGQVEKAGKLAQIGKFLNKPIAGSADDIISKVGGGAIDNFAPVANSLNSPFGASKNKIMEILGKSGATSQVDDAVSTVAKATDAVVAPKKSVAPGIKSTNVKPEVIKPEPVVAPPQPKAPVIPKSTDETLAGLKGKRELLAAERDDLLTNGGDYRDVEKQIKAIDRAISEYTTPPKTPEAKVLADGDKQLADAVPAKPVISKQELPSKPKKVDNANNVNLSADELRARGVSEEGIAREMARQAEATPVEVPKKAPKVVETEKVDVAQSTPTPVKQTEAEALSASRAKTRAKTVAEAKPELPSKPTQAQLDKGATENTIKSGKVSKAWKNEQKAAGATDEEIAKAAEKVEGRKVAPTEKEKVVAENRAENNKVAKENKAKAEAEGKDKQAAPGVTKALAKQRALETATKEEVASIARRYAAQTKSVNIEEGMTKAQASLDEISDDGILEQARKLMDETSDIDDADRVFNSIALSKRLDLMRKEAGKAGLKLDKELVDLADEVAQNQALTSSSAGLVNRLTQEIYKNVPAPVRVQRRLDKLTEKFAKLDLEFKPTQAQTDELVSLTDSFDSSATAMTGLEDDITANMDEFAKLKNQRQADKLFKNHKKLEQAHKAAQENAVADSLAFNEKLKSMLPELSKSQKFRQSIVNSPDHVSNYLRMAMLSSPTGRVRDAASTAINVADQSIVNLISSTIGKVLNKTRGTNLIDSYGSKAATKKGIGGAWDKIKGSWHGKPTLDEATGRIPKADRAELNKAESITSFGIDHGEKGSKWNLPKKMITTTVQGPTDVSYGLFTDRLYKLGQVEARANGITNKKQIKQYAEMFMDNPSKEAALDAGETWLKSSGMQKNALSRKLTKVAQDLDSWGSKTVDSSGNKLSTAQQFARKSVARTVRTTTIPFVQYTGGSTHAMLMGQNPLSNFNQARKAFKAGNVQKGVDDLARGGWNTAKIGGLIAAMESNMIETSDTDADGKTSYNGPYVVNTRSDGSKEYIPMGSYGIAGGAALISAHYLRRGYNKMKDGDVVGGMGDIVAGPPMAIVKASGLDNMLSGTNIVGGATETFQRTNSDPTKSPGDVVAAVGGGIVGDIGSQAVPALSRDINSFYDQNPKYNPTGEKPDTSGKDPVTGKVNPLRKATAQVTSGIPVLSQNLPRKSGEKARDIQGRILNANTQSEQQAASIKAGKDEETTTINRTADVVSDDKVANLLSEETRAIYDKYKGDMSKASQEDSKKIWKEVTAAKDRLLDDGSYTAYKKILTYERDEGKSKGTSTATEVAEMDRKIGRADVADKRGTKPQIFRLYTGTDTPEGGGLSASEFKKMLQLDDDGNPKYPDVYDKETAILLWELDEAMTKAGVSGNTNGIDPWTRNKYDLDEALGRGKYDPKNKGSGSGSKDKGIGTDFGTIGAYAKSPGGQSQKYQKLANAGSPLANLTKSSSRTNLRKNISVVKGVRL